MPKKMTVPDFRRFKQEGRKWTSITCYDYTMASIVNESPACSILVGDSLGNVIQGKPTTVPVTLDEMIHHIAAVAAGAPDTLIIGDMPFGSYNVSNEDAIRSANRMMKEGGCDCLKLEGGSIMAERIRAIVDSGTPVMGHIGVTPQTAGATGGYKVRGKTVDAAQKLLDDALAIEAAGACAIVLECIPSVVAKKITETLEIPTIGTGAGPDCDCQQLNLYDITGLFGDFKPKFVKRYAEMRKEMVEVFRQFDEETVSGVFPSPEYSYNTTVK